MTISFYDQSFNSTAERKKAWSLYVKQSRDKNKDYCREYNRHYVAKKSYAKHIKSIDEICELIKTATDDTELVKLNKKLIIKQRYLYKSFLRLQSFDLLPPGPLDKKYKGDFYKIMKISSNTPPDDEYKSYLNY